MYGVSVVKRFPRERFISKKKHFVAFWTKRGTIFNITLKLYFMGVKGKNYETFVLMDVVRVIRGSVHTPPKCIIENTWT